MNQTKEILDYIKAHPGANAQDIAKATGWNRHIVDVATQMLTQNNLIREVGRTEWDDPKHEAF